MLQSFLLLIVILMFDHMLYLAAWVNTVSIFSKHYSMLSFWFPVLLLLYWKKKLNIKYCKCIIRVFILILTITSLTTIISLYIYPLASRELSMATMGKDVIHLYKLNIGSYGFIYGLVSILPFVWNGNIIVKKRHQILLTTIYTICIIKSNITLAIIMELAFVMLTIWKRVRSQRIRKGILLCIISIVTIGFIGFLISGREGILNLFISISKFKFIANNELLKERVMGVAYVLTGVNNADDVSSRIMLYRRSITCFFSSPLIGMLANNTLEFGAHSEILDVFAATGLVGGSLFIGLIVYSFKQTYFEKTSKYCKKYLPFVGCFAVFSMINTIFYCPLVMFSLIFVPVIDRIFKELKDV